MKTHLNLIPLAVRRQTLIRTRIKQWALVWIATGALCALVGVAQFCRLSSVGAEVQVLESRAEPVRKLMAENDRMAREITDLENNVALLTQPSEVNRVLDLLAQVSEGTEATEGEIRLEQFRIQDVSVTTNGTKRPSDSARAPQIESRRQLSLIGVALNDHAVSRLVTELRQSEVFESVQLKGSSRTAQSAQTVRHFEIVCLF